jgi:hypothetical protein
MPAAKANPWGSYDTRDQIFGRRQRVAFNIGLPLAVVVGFLLIACAFIVPAVVLRQVLGRQVALALAAAGSVLALAFAVLALNYWSTITVFILKPRVAEKVSRKHGTDLSGAWFVGISPGSDIRSFGGDTSLDVGFLRIESGRLLFYGDILDCELRRSAVTDIQLQRAALLINICRIVVKWTDTSGATQELALEAEDALQTVGRSPKTHALADQLRTWLQDAVPERQARDFAEPPVVADFAGIRAAPFQDPKVSCLGAIGGAVLTAVSAEMFDWLLDRRLISLGTVWIVFLAALVLLTVLPWLRRRRSSRNAGD